MNSGALAGKMALPLFFNYRGALLVEFIHGKKRINSNAYTGILMRLNNQIKHKRPGLLTLWPVFHHDSARPYMVVTLSGILSYLVNSFVAKYQLPFIPSWILVSTYKHVESSCTIVHTPTPTDQVFPVLYISQQ